MSVLAKTKKEKLNWDKWADIISWLLLAFAVIYFAPPVIKAFWG
jgi:hypothetical protein